MTGHLCATTYTEAAELGIDAIEHGFMHSYDLAEGKTYGECTRNTAFRSETIIDDPKVTKVHQSLIDHNVALTSTLAISAIQSRKYGMDLPERIERVLDT
ncbi:hypothetical protein [Gramella sp. KN1008]|uniref:hypothetical protein n=1 Tax=Gramella sp. KN1008 TaxID=2529298 RepID=UPI00103B7915|nr:hypothetical protein [Gramella sp. KN1008]TBW26542.1 hypothetical protein EZJ28_14155 [Gramella sp. KN1008]